jgi:hypothetical protein
VLALATDGLTTVSLRSSWPSFSAQIPQQRQTPMSLVHLTLAANETEADIICSLLQSEQIACTHRQNLSPMAYGGTENRNSGDRHRPPLALELIAGQEDDAA